jgi:hypothetical protein
LSEALAAGEPAISVDTKKKELELFHNESPYPAAWK